MSSDWSLDFSELSRLEIINFGAKESLAKHGTWSPNDSFWRKNNHWSFSLRFLPHSITQNKHLFAK